MSNTTLTPEQLYSSKEHYNKWLKELTPNEVELILDITREYGLQEYNRGKADAQAWISVEEMLPEDIKSVSGLCEINSITKEGEIISVFYTKGDEVNYSDDDFDGDRPLTDKEHRTGELYLTPGWYQICEQRSNDYDFIYMKRNITHWMPLPSPPKEQ